MSNKIRIIFTVSVILNILLLGAAGGAAYHRWQDRPMNDMQEAMSPEGRNIVARTTQKAFSEGRKDMDAARAAKKELRAVISAETFDPQAYDAASKKLGEAMRTMGQKRAAVTKDLAQQLSQEDRKILAERFSKGFHGHRKGEKKEYHGDNKKPGDEKAHHFLKEQAEGAPLSPEAANTEENAPDVIKGVRPIETPELPDDMPPPPENKAAE